MSDRKNWLEKEVSIGTHSSFPAKVVRGLPSGLGLNDIEGEDRRRAVFCLDVSYVCEQEGRSGCPRDEYLRVRKA